MGVHFTPSENSALHRLLAEHTSDIILKADRDGYIMHASPAIERWGLPLPNSLIGSHILHLVHPSHAAAVKAEYEAVVGGQQNSRWVEFAALTSDGQMLWFEIQMQRLEDEHGEVYGTVSIMRSIDERKTLEEKLFVAAMTDPLTGLANRAAFISMLQHLLDDRTSGSLAIFAIDNFRSINMQHGQSAGDEVLVAFSDFLRSMMSPADIISRIGGESLGILFPTAAPDQAEAICRKVIKALPVQSPGYLSITASAGIARIEGSLDDTIRRAELTLFLAKAKGPSCLEVDRSPPEGTGGERIVCEAGPEHASPSNASQPVSIFPSIARGDPAVRARPRSVSREGSALVKLVRAAVRS